MRASQEKTATAATVRQRGPVVLGRYRLLRQLGAGGFGTVWEAHDERLDRAVAVKVLPRERIVGGRFEREAKAAARLSHPGIVTLYEAAVDDDGAYLVSELVRGGTLAELLTDGRLSDRDVLRIGVALCDALEHAHGHGIVHRDVKPSNILVPERPGNPAQPAKLTDFGVARVIGGDSLTRTGDVVGTLAYMAPEQAEGREAGAAADLYSTALVLYEALTGVNPVLTGTVAVRARRLGAHLPPLRRQRRELPRELGQAIDLALRPRARERGSLAGLRQALAGSAEQVDDRPGVVEGAWPEWAPTARAPLAAGPRQPKALARPGPARPAWPVLRALPVRWPVRGLGAAVAAGVAAWLSAHPLAPAPSPPAVAALVAAIAVAVLPRLGWLALVLAGAGVAAAHAHPGLALVLAAAGLLPLLVLPRDGPAWPLAALCPALGGIALAGVWPALAARAGTPWRRAGVAALGWLWLLAASPLAGRALYVRVRPAPPAGWSSSAASALHAVIAPRLGVALLAPAVAWAAGAAVLPYVRGRRPVTGALILCAVWAALLSAATAAALRIGGGGHGLVPAGEAVLSAAASVAVALVPVLPSAGGDRFESPDADPQVP